MAIQNTLLKVIDSLGLSACLHRRCRPHSTNVAAPRSSSCLDRSRPSSLCRPAGAYTG